MVDRRTALEERDTAAPLVIDERAERGRRRADIQHFRPMRHVRHDRFHAVLDQLFGERRLRFREAFRRDDVGAEA
jgi:hypothetical protein